jgi:hypothetical protein
MLAIIQSKFGGETILLHHYNTFLEHFPFHTAKEIVSYLPQ